MVTKANKNSLVDSARKFMSSREAEVIPAAFGGLTAAIVAGLQLVPAIGIAAAAALGYAIVQRKSD